MSLARPRQRAPRRRHRGAALVVTLLSVLSLAGAAAAGASPASLSLVKDLNPLDDRAGGGGAPTPFAFGSTIYFAQSSPEYRSELWRTDGTEAGTRLVKDINPAGAPAPRGSWPSTDSCTSAPTTA